MIPNTTKASGEKTLKSIVTSILGLILIVSSVIFTVIGIFNLIRALFTSYNLQTIDLMYFTSGMLLLFSMAIVNVLTEIRDQNKTIAKGVLHLLKNKIGSSPMPAASFGDVLKNLFGRQPGMSDDDVSGSISLYDPNDPDNQIFKGDFKNANEMDDIRKSLIEKMLNSQTEVRGKKMTKQEMLNELSLRELKAELKTAVETEDWLWAASLRDKIGEKEEGNNSEEKNNPEV